MEGTTLAKFSVSQNTADQKYRELALTRLDGNLSIIPLLKKLFNCARFPYISSFSSRTNSSDLSIYLSQCPNRPSLLAGSLDCIQCPHRADVSPCWSTNTGVSMCRNHKRTSLMSLSFVWGGERDRQTGRQTDKNIYSIFYKFFFFLRERYRKCESNLNKKLFKAFYFIV